MNSWPAGRPGTLELTKRETGIGRNHETPQVETAFGSGFGGVRRTGCFSSAERSIHCGVPSGQWVARQREIRVDTGRFRADSCGLDAWECPCRAAAAGCADCSRRNDGYRRADEPRDGGSEGGHPCGWTPLGFARREIPSHECCGHGRRWKSGSPLFHRFSRNGRRASGRAACRSTPARNPCPLDFLVFSPQS